MNKKIIKHLTFFEKSAFTLAEVLITLGIIGVVAAITIPTVVRTYQQKTWDTSAKVFERKLEETLKTMNTQQTLAGHPTSESFVVELSKHFKTNKICKNDELLDCFSKTVYWGRGENAPEEIDMSKIKTAKNFGQDDWNTDIVGVQFANGTSALIAYNPTTGENSCTQDSYSNTITGGDCLAILYDTSGEKNPNVSGKDLRSNSNVTKLGNACFSELNGICITTAPFRPTPITKAECEKLMPVLGIQTCSSDGDYWAGAVKACGGTNKMPTQAQLVEIANYIYNTDVIGQSGTTTGLFFDATRATNFGFPSPTFQVWSNREIGDNYAFYQRYNSDGISWYYGQGNSSLLAFCIDN